MHLQAVAALSDELAATSSRGAKVARIAELLATAEPAEAAIVVAWLSGELTQRQIGVGWAALRDLPQPASEPTLAVSEVDDRLGRIGTTSGAGSQAVRRQLLANLFGAATGQEQAFLTRLLTGDLRQGALAGVMTDAVARAAGLPLADIRRAAMLSGDLARVATAALAGGALAQFRLQVGRPVSPMLAQTASSVEDGLATLGGEAALEWKLDGARIQIHRSGAEVALFTRSLDDVTSRMPEVVDAVRRFAARELVADAEVIALRPDGRPQPFQVTASRFGSRSDPAVLARTAPLSPFVFDLLHLDGRDVLDSPADARWRALDALLPEDARIPRLVTADADAARDFLAGALAHGQEGVMVKSLTAPYEAGRRGAGWLKVKLVHTLDLVVLAVEWGSGRRKGKLSNIHLGARSEAGGFVMLGKTFKGMTDAMLDWQTKRFLSLADGPTDSWVVRLRPEQVVEIAFDGVQRSSRYPAGLALRFARVLRYRDDKRPDEADTIDGVCAFYVE